MSSSYEVTKRVKQKLRSDDHCGDTSLSLTIGHTQRPCITRRWTNAVVCLGWLDMF
jgi:hypothetical protein